MSKIDEMNREKWILSSFPEWGTWLNEEIDEEVAMMSWHAKIENPSLESMDQNLLDKHFLRKHGKNAYYGQK